MTLFLPQNKFDVNKLSIVTIGIIVMIRILNESIKEEEEEVGLSRGNSKSPWLVVDDHDMRIPTPSLMENDPPSPKPSKFYLFTSSFFDG